MTNAFEHSSSQNCDDSGIPGVNIIAYSDSYIVLDKPSGLLSVPGKNEPDCLEARAQAKFPDALTVHRLDMATSGICVMARGKTNLTDLQQQFEKRRVQKTYEAIVWGRMNEDQGTVDAPMLCDWPNRPLQKIDFTNGRSAVTHWEVIEQLENSTRVALKPVTGRSHQLRVHMKSLGHAILGDPWYAEGEARAASARLLLHARELTFRDPATALDLTFESPCPF